MEKINVAGLNISRISKTELLHQILIRLQSGKKTFITTPYSEFLYHSLLHPKDEQILNNSDFAVADGIAILWAAKFLSVPITIKNYSGKILQAFWQAFWTLNLILLKPSAIKKIIPEKIVGAELIWDLAKLASENNFSVFLLGGFKDTPNLAGKKLQEKFPKLKIAGVSNKNPEDPLVYEGIKKASPDLLFVAYGPIKQERWIAHNLPNLPVKLAIGIGGTLDYLAGIKPLPPKFIRYTGLEWLWRLFTQPKRFRRIINATFGLIFSLVKYKVMKSLPFRKNAVSVVFNQNQEIFIARFNPSKKIIKALGRQNYNYENFWQFPQGGIEPDEELLVGAKRELFEETHIKNVKHLFTSHHTFSYEWQTGIRPLFVTKRYHFKGQMQNILYFKFVGKDSEIKLDNDELLEWKWIKPEYLLNILHKDKQNLAIIALNDLKELQEKAII